ncbi:MAG: NAD(P)/FAD-dependent oxidoreductase [Microbacterium sp.]|uniref:NAD(P)/FAD-dependent oxidoreductase n=1 Tax=Microbacterium sp. TaxID=51671 RepID=UPI003F7DB0B8
MTAREAGRVVVVGGGVAGLSAARSLRTLGHAGRVTLVDPEPCAYDRPPLSKKLFDPDFGLDTVTLADDAALERLGIASRFGRRAVGIDAEAGSVLLDSGETLAADTILLATGGRARMPRIPGIESSAVHVLRTFADAQRLREAVRPESRVVVVGAGLIGAELASSLRGRGSAVTLVDPVETPLVPAVGEAMAAALHAMHEPRGVVVVQGLVERIEGEQGGAAVVLVDGRRIEGDVVVVGIGIEPRDDLARAAGLEVGGGIAVDEEYQTSAANVFAAGDVALRAVAGGAARREEHWEAAQLSGEHAAYAMLGLPVPERGAAWFWSDRHGVHLEAVGRMTGPGTVVLRASSGRLAVFLVDDGRLVGAAALDEPMTVRAARRLIDQRVPVAASDLADPAVTLRSLLRAGA